VIKVYGIPKVLGSVVRKVKLHQFICCPVWHNHRHQGWGVGARWFPSTQGTLLVFSFYLLENPRRNRARLALSAPVEDGPKTSTDGQTSESKQAAEVMAEAMAFLLRPLELNATCSISFGWPHLCTFVNVSFASGKGSFSHIFEDSQEFCTQTTQHS